MKDRNDHQKNLDIQLTNDALWMIVGSLTIYYIYTHIGDDHYPLLEILLTNAYKEKSRRVLQHCSHSYPFSTVGIYFLAEWYDV